MSHELFSSPVGDQSSWLICWVFITEIFSKNFYFIL